MDLLLIMILVLIMRRTNDKKVKYAKMEQNANQIK